MAKSPKKPSAESPVAVGTLVANTYRVERILGIGGMGVVVEATHVDLEEPRALKFMLPTVSKDAEGVARFFREARATARLKSEHVAHIFDLGRLQDDTPFLVMEYLEGRDLGSILQDEVRLPIPDAVDYAMQALAALAEAHAVGIVHRDLKPANLFVTTGTDGLPLVKIVDFGVSKLLGRQSGAADLTLARAVVGSPHYMSPEQLASARHVDWRTDLWSIGVILYEMLTGRQPFEGSSLTAVTIEVVQASPDPPSSIRAGVTPELDAVVMKCLAKKPEERYRHAADIAAELAPFGPSRALALAEHIARVHEVALASDRAVAPELNELDWERVLEGDGDADPLHDEAEDAKREAARPEAAEDAGDDVASSGREPAPAKGKPLAPPRPNAAPRPTAPLPARRAATAGAAPGERSAARRIGDVEPARPPGPASPGADSSEQTPSEPAVGSEPDEGDSVDAKRAEVERAAPSSDGPNAEAAEGAVAERTAPPSDGQAAAPGGEEEMARSGDGVATGPEPPQPTASGSASIELAPSSTSASSEIVDLSAELEEAAPAASPAGKHRIAIAVAAAGVVLVVAVLVWPRSTPAPSADDAQPSAPASQSLTTTSSDESAAPETSSEPTTEPPTPDAGGATEDAATPDASAPAIRRPPQPRIGRGKLPDIYDD